MEEILKNYLELLWNSFQYDMEIYGEEWVWYTVIPLILYTIVFFIKWIVLTTPMWLPIRLALGGLKFTPVKKYKRKKKGHSINTQAVQNEKES